MSDCDWVVALTRDSGKDVRHGVQLLLLDVGCVVVQVMIIGREMCGFGDGFQARHFFRSKFVKIFYSYFHLSLSISTRVVDI